MAKNKDYEIALKISAQLDSSFNSAISQATSQLEKFGMAGKLIGKIGSGFSSGISAANSGITSLRNGVEELSPVFDKIGSVGKKAFKGIATVATAAATATVAIGSSVIKEGAEFESQMSTVKALSGANTGEMKIIENKAKEMGATTVWTATDAGKAEEYMAMAGWNAEEIVASLPAVMYTANASGESLATTSDILTDAMTSFGYAANEQTNGVANATYFSDVMAAAATNANTTVGLMGETFKYAGSVAGAMGYSIDDVAIATGLMANSAIKGSQAGTALRSIMKRMAAPTKESAIAMATLGISLMDSEGNANSFYDIMVKIRESMAKFSEDKQLQLASQLAGTPGMSGLLAITNATDEEFNKLTKAVKNCSGAAEFMSKIKLDNLNGDVALFQSAVSGLKLDVFEDFGGTFREIVQAGTDFVSKISEKNSKTNFMGHLAESFKTEVPTIYRYLQQGQEYVQDFISNIDNVAKKLIDSADGISAGISGGLEPAITVIEIAFDCISSIGNWAIEHSSFTTSAIMGIVGAFMTFKGIEKVSSSLTFVQKFFSAVTASPVTKIIAIASAIGGLVSAISSYNKSTKEIAMNNNLAEHFGDVSLSLSEIEQIADRITDIGIDEDIEVALSFFADRNSYIEAASEAQAELNKYNWKVSVGFNLSEAEQQNYLDNVQSAIENTQKALDEQQCGVSIGLELFTSDSKVGQNTRNSVNAYFSGLQEELNSVSSELSKTATAAFEDNFLDIDEAETIQKLLDKLASIEQQISDAEFSAKLTNLRMDIDYSELTPESYQNLMQGIQTAIDEKLSDQLEVRQQLLVSIEASYKAGKMNKSQYDQAVQELFQQGQSQKVKVQLEGVEVGINTIEAKYGDEIDKFVSKIPETIQYALENAYTISGQVDFTFLLEDLISGLEIDDSTQLAISNLTESIRPMAEEIKASYETLSSVLSDSEKVELDKFLQQFNALDTISGNQEAALELIAQNIASSEQLQEKINSLKEQGANIPEELNTQIQKAEEALERTKKISDEYKKLNDENLGETPKIDLSNFMSNWNTSELEKQFQSVGNTVETIKNATGGAVESIEKVGGAVETVKNATGGAVESLEKIGGAVETVKNATGSAVESLENVGEAVESIESATNGAIESIEKIGEEALNINFETIAIDGELDASSIEEKAKTSGEAVGNSLVSGITSKQQEVVAAAKTLYDALTFPESILTSASEGGAAIPQNIATSIEANASLANTAIDTLYSTIKSKIETTFSTGFSVEVPIEVNAKANVSTSNSNNIESHYNGGIVMSPILTTFAEKGPEAAIPIDGSQNAINLWKKTGQMLGIYNDNVAVEKNIFNTSKTPSIGLDENMQKFYVLANNINNIFNNAKNENGFSSAIHKFDEVFNSNSNTNTLNINNTNKQIPINITYNSTININGTANKDDIINAEKESQEYFRKKVEEYEKHLERVSFAR